MILFLDFDGVLHPDQVYRVRGQPVLRAEGELFMWAGILADVLADQPHVRIVLSTSWVRELRFARARDYLLPELRSRVIGATWHPGMKTDEEYRPLGRSTWWDRSARYEQVRRYVDRAQLQHWVAVDDTSDGWGQSDLDKLVHTHRDRGLSDPEAVKRLTTLLGGKA